MMQSFRQVSIKVLSAKYHVSTEDSRKRKENEADRTMSWFHYASQIYRAIAQVKASVNQIMTT